MTFVIARRGCPAPRRLERCRACQRPRTETARLPASGRTRAGGVTDECEADSKCVESQIRDQALQPIVSSYRRRRSSLRVSALVVSDVEHRITDPCALFGLAQVVGDPFLGES